MIDFKRVPSPCFLLDERLLARRVGRRGDRRAQSVRHVEYLPPVGASQRRRDGQFGRRGPAGTRRVRAAGAHVCSGLHRPQYRRDTRLQQPYHLQFARTIPPFRCNGAAARHLVRSARQPALFARGDRSLQPLRGGFAAGSDRRGAGNAGRSARRDRGAAFPCAVRIAVGASPQGARSRRAAFRPLSRPHPVAQHGRRPPDDPRRLRLR